MAKSPWNNENLEAKALVFEPLLKAEAIPVDALAITGFAVLDNAVSFIKEIVAKKKQDNDLTRQLTDLETYRANLQDMIKALEAEIADLTQRRQEAIDAAQEAFDKAHEAEDLLKAIADGISEDERQRLIALIGEDPLLLEDAELQEKLNDINDTENDLGRTKSEEADELEKRIKAKEQEHAAYKEYEKSLLSDNDFERHNAMLKVDELMNFENQIKSNTEVNFTMPGLN